MVISTRENFNFLIDRLHAYRFSSSRIRGSPKTNKSRAFQRRSNQLRLYNLAAQRNLSRAKLRTRFRLCITPKMHRHRGDRSRPLNDVREGSRTHGIVARNRDSRVSRASFRENKPRITNQPAVHFYRADRRKEKHGWEKGNELSRRESTA